MKKPGGFRLLFFFFFYLFELSTFNEVHEYVFDSGARTVHVGILLSNNAERINDGLLPISGHLLASYTVIFTRCVSHRCSISTSSS